MGAVDLPELSRKPARKEEEELVVLDGGAESRPLGRNSEDP
jgi:hypothetical protein